MPFTLQGEKRMNAAVLWPLASLILLVYACLGGWAIYLIVRQYRYNHTARNTVNLIRFIKKDYSLETESLDAIDSQMHAILEWRTKTNNKIQKVLLWPVLILLIIGLKNLVYPGDLGREFGLFLILIVLATSVPVLIGHLLRYNLTIALNKVMKLRQE